MRARFTIVVAMALAALLGNGTAAAHALELFANGEGQRIVGSVYFTSGTPADDAEITIYGPEGEQLGTPTPNDAGEFDYKVKAVADYRVVARSADGHEAERQVAAKEFADGDASGSGSPGAHGATTDGATVTMQRDQLQALIRRAVAAEVGPLRAEVHSYANRVRLGDILGGLGLIAGLAGVFMAWRTRRRGV